MNVFATVKTSINTREAAARYGVEVNRHGKALCPFHNDRHPSLFVDDDHYHQNRRKHLYHAFAVQHFQRLLLHSL